MHRPVLRRLDERRDRARVQPAREARADGDVAPHPHSDRVAEQLAEPLLDVALRSLVARLEAPGRAALEVVPRPDEARRRRHRADVREEGRLSGVGELAVEEARDLASVGLALLGERGQDRLRLGREGNPAVALRVADRLDPEPVAREDERALACVPEAERPHPVEALERVLAPRGIRVQDDLGVGVRAEARAARLELAPELDVVVDLAVVREPEASLRKAHRLVAGGRGVDDREPPVREADLAVEPDT